MTTNRPQAGTGTSRAADTGTGTGSRRSTITSSEAQARAMVSNWYADAQQDGEELLALMEDNDGVPDDEVPDGILDAWDDDLLELPRETDPEHRQTRWSPRPHIVFWQSGGAIDWEVRPIPESMYDDPLLLSDALAHAERLERLAAALAGIQRKALLSPTVAGAVHNLVYLSKTRLADEAGVESQTGSKISRDRHMILEAPFGLVTLDLFTWASRQGWQARVDAIQLLDVLLREDPAMSANAAGQIAAVRTGVGAGIRKHIPALRNIQRHPDVVATHRRSFPQTSWQSLREDVGSDGDIRGKPVMCLALVGAIGTDATIGATE